LSLDALFVGNALYPEVVLGRNRKNLSRGGWVPGTDDHSQGKHHLPLQRCAMPRRSAPDTVSPSQCFVNDRLGWAPITKGSGLYPNWQLDGHSGSWSEVAARQLNHK